MPFVSYERNRLLPPSQKDLEVSWFSASRLGLWLTDLVIVSGVREGPRRSFFWQTDTQLLQHPLLKIHPLSAKLNYRGSSVETPSTCWGRSLCELCSLPLMCLLHTPWLLQLYTESWNQTACVFPTSSYFKSLVILVSLLSPSDLRQIHSWDFDWGYTDLYINLGDTSESFSREHGRHWLRSSLSSLISVLCFSALVCIFVVVVYS